MRFSVIIRCHEAACCSVIRCVAACHSVLLCDAVCCNALRVILQLQLATTHCITLQHTTLVSVYSLLHVGCHFFNLKSQSIFNFSWSLLPRSIENQPMRLRLENGIERNSTRNILYLTHTYLCLWVYYSHTNTKELVYTNTKELV